MTKRIIEKIERLISYPQELKPRDIAYLITKMRSQDMLMILWCKVTNRLLTEIYARVTRH